MPRIALIGLGTIGLSMAALHLDREDTSVAVFDPRPDLNEYIRRRLPQLLSSSQGGPVDTLVDTLFSNSRLSIHDTLSSAVSSAEVIQEQGPENEAFKQRTWREIETLALPSAQFWSSTSGIAASIQNVQMTDPSRLLVVHPFNPPHIMPLIEIVPGPTTKQACVDFAVAYFSKHGHHRPVVVRKEIPGFVGNRLAFALFREACSLVNEGVVHARDLDTIVMASLGPRWATQGVFESYHAGGGEGGLASFLDKLGGTMQQVWDGLGTVNVKPQNVDAQDDGVQDDGVVRWKEKVVDQVNEAYGPFTADKAKKKETLLKQVLDVQKDI
ncbi:hypothetical protein ASPZODRAFT_17479 [Penicilliopsis zonata CBS 506.65]|uniref:L-gulonate 3-dehydrogenase n=1 Tax=Penicilliopsis zonata CBS 506.65 TaxID=1073090 RepID=A0A1L9SDP1_9EURO|nr:hypothetical protein ASPZODRAFT_17479 [Penicilliopsis zonata CBS 506.65]OJJ45258.1 hypothetical protein ASPZODRAFT_17479 [Penicilliopsis zonata CBS 506.65]